MAPLNLRTIRFTDRADKVYSNNGIYNPRGSRVRTLRGADEIIGNNWINSDLGFGVLNGIGTRNAGAFAASTLTGKANVKANGLNNEGNIYTNAGRDIVRGNATAKIAAVAQTVSQAIAYAEKLDASAVAATFAQVNINAIANGIKNSGDLDTGNGNDSVTGDIDASLAAVATATADATAIVKGVAEAPLTDSLTAFAQAIAVSLANASIIATGLNNSGGELFTRKGIDNINATATSESNTFAQASAFASSAATPGNQAIALTVAEAIATTQDKAIAIDNSRGRINTGTKADTIKATANAVDKGVAIENSRGIILTGNGADKIEANATGSESYGIFGGTIRTGNGDDKIEASSFGGGVNIWMGDGDDFVKGFGSAKVYGGKDYDILSLGSSRIEDFDISLGATDKNQVFFEQNGITMKTSDFEQFNFANGSFSYDALVARI